MVTVQKTGMQKVGIIDAYKIKSGDTYLNINIERDPKEFVLIYNLETPQIEKATLLLLENVRNRLIEEVRVKVEEIVDPKAFEALKNRYKQTAENIIQKELPRLSADEKSTVINYLINKMLGLAQIEPIFSDDNIEEVVINRADTPVWIYHKKHGWLKTNIIVESEEQIHNFASIIGRRVGREITNLSPLMDARLPSGDRVNATLFPISTFGNTLTVRKFARTPWTVIDFIDPKVNSLSPDIAALLWFGIENEINLLIAGGTGSGKTSMLNSLTAFMPSNQRIISIEDTRELQLPNFLQWIPMATRSPNPEGKGEVTMLDLMINSLRMRPDKMIVGEVRRAREAEVLFEAMHTGHSVYSTLHADTIEQTYRRLVNPPINVPVEMLETLHLILVQFRQRRLNIRRTLQVAEVVVPKQQKEAVVNFNLLYRWDPKGDKMSPVNKSQRIVEELQLRTGMSSSEMAKNLDDKEKILKWMLKSNTRDINAVGRIVNTYYTNEDYVLDVVNKNKNPAEILEQQV
ncbi:TPA: CpaF family protein [archaeon]|uniref:CpaF family protein n=1 Tax=Candidatus Naiadarchaeum limnaeum TaxID=2756139 RepID=A0A832XJE2_9ARCH|nr:CpaF family protein [Candidatus Naiadarchaeum limnaeum]